MKRIRDKGFRQFISSLPCLRCKRPAPSQAAHIHERMNKTLASKESDEYIIPLCADTPSGVGCHTKLDQHKDDYWTEEKVNKARTLRFYVIYKNGSNRGLALEEILRFHNDM